MCSSNVSIVNSDPVATTAALSLARLPSATWSMTASAIGQEPLPKMARLLCCHGHSPFPEPQSPDTLRIQKLLFDLWGAKRLQLLSHNIFGDKFWRIKLSMHSRVPIIFADKFLFWGKEPAACLLRQVEVLRASCNAFLLFSRLRSGPPHCVGEHKPFLISRSHGDLPDVPLWTHACSRLQPSYALCTCLSHSHSHRVQYETFRRHSRLTVSHKKTQRGMRLSLQYCQYLGVAF